MYHISKVTHMHGNCMTHVLTTAVWEHQSKSRRESQGGPPSHPGPPPGGFQIEDKG